MTKFLSTFFVVTTLFVVSACSTLTPQTYAGWQAGGLPGALNALSGAIVAKCKTLDGREFTINVDNLANAVGAVDSLEEVREKRKRACVAANAVLILSTETE